MGISIKILALIFLCLFSFSCSVKDKKPDDKWMVYDSTREALEKNDAKKVKFVLPVNVVQSEKFKKVHLLVSMKNGFKYIPSGSNNMYEFVSEYDKDLYKWTKIITVQSFVGDRFEAEKFIKKVLSAISRTSPNAVVLNERYGSHHLYNEGTATIVYFINGRQELMKLYMVAGPYDSVVVQYSSLVKSEKEFENIIERQNSFFKDSLKLLFFDKPDDVVGKDVIY